MLLIDANVALRYILGNDIELAQKAKNIIDNNDIEMPIEVLSEVVFVLKSVYGIDKKIIYSKLIYFLENTACEIPHKEAVLLGLKYYSETKLHFVDCILAGYNEIEGYEVATFDIDLQKFIAKIKR